MCKGVSAAQCPWVAQQPEQIAASGSLRPPHAQDQEILFAGGLFVRRRIHWKASESSQPSLESKRAGLARMLVDLDDEARVVARFCCQLRASQSNRFVEESMGNFLRLRTPRAGGQHFQFLRFN